MLPPQSAAQSTGISFSSLGECVVAGIKVFALGQFLRQEILLVGQFAIEAEELGFFFC